MSRSGKTNSGQATIEYILILSVIVSLFLGFNRALGKLNIPGRLMKNFSGPFANVYQYGHPKASGPDRGSEVKNHPRYGDDSGNNFRIFISPQQGGG